MAIRYYTSKEICKLLDVSEEEFHRKIKKLIKKDFENELQAIDVTNPDILLDEKFLIYLADPRDHRIYIETKLEIFAYI